MKLNIISEIALSIVLVVLVVLFLDPLMILMPKGVLYVALLLLLLLFVAFAGFIWREKVVDERENLHRQFAGRVAHLVGAGVLVLGIIVQALVENHVDGWLVIALVAMLIAKSSGLIYSWKKH